ncbi:hypothetical protein DL769_004712 [Monosporascus sp. CRB-8-3]|nr:hypothetical protein DL769_004712 [Monosporascus sp. CRB-8-3]
MRLLKLPTLDFEEFQDETIPPYAILSHTWEKDEVSYHQMINPSRETATMDGFAKIRRFADVTLSPSVEYAWVDTCCIDKTSSGELSKAINSMYRWYKNATKCYVYLADLEGLNGLNECRWFSRGWTLQELIAPGEMEFYDKNWQILGNKRMLLDQLASATGIPIAVLRNCDPSLASVAQRMSWASKRKTTRIEDVAYCLMGIFDVNMPLLYGEGQKAFIRLQEEIMKYSDDHSLFAWKA